MATILNMKELLEAGVHFGHQTRRWNPKMKPYIFGSRNGIHIIDLQKTVSLFNEIYNFIVRTVSEGYSVLFVGTKKQSHEAIISESERCGMFGRYIFTLMSYQAHRTYLAIGNIELELIGSLQKHRHTTAKSSKNALRQLMVNGLKSPKNWFLNFPQIVKTTHSAMSCYWVFRRDMRKVFRSIATHENWDKKTLKHAITDSKRLTRRYIAKILKLSLMNMVQNILLNWRMIHANLLYLLALTATAHIVAVHMY